MKDIRPAILTLLNSVSVHQYKTIDEVKENSIARELDAPLHHTSELFGKIPVNEHILASDYKESSISDLFQM